MVHRIVHQHHPHDIQYSLEDVATEASAFVDDLTDDLEDCKVIGYPLPAGEAWVLYSRGTSGTAEDISASLAADEMGDTLSEMDSTSRVIAIWLLNFFAEMQTEERELGNSLSIYKELEIERVPEAVNQIDWDGSVTDVAGRLMSNLVLRHSLPNANHRTGITMAQAYLEAAGANFEMPSTTTEEYEWRAWVRPYILESKRILTVRRHNLYFNTLAELGCEVVRRKHDIDIPLTEYDLDMHHHEAWTVYAQMHEEHCIGLVEDIAARGGSSELIDRAALSEQDFVEFLQNENADGNEK
ncbi:hypothetical protein SAMN05216559_1810 [Halomicrobium zhouii]|uniref:Uncharacterized protein n=1 Tax=Halomicrobium zhouii TaxID=767519 RepID=A0A1I6L1X6_9EURY|nr:hypothetical protein [Halomicrobium zhouii]SFR97210.1 hypothetical protein SAMN05216559_1810 [Halomicrobium zhouii]